MNLTITGDIPSKKNSKQIVYLKSKTGKSRPIVIPSKNHEIWHTQAISQLLGKHRVEGQILRLEAVFYPSTKRKSDLSNKFESIADLLVDAGIISDDNWFVVPEVSLKFGGVDKENPRAEITIYELAERTADAPL